MYKLMEPNWEVRETVIYRLLVKGVSAMSDVELVALVAGTTLPQARALLTHFGSLLALSRAGIQDLCRVKDMTQPSASRLVCGFELHRRKSQECSTPLQLNGAEKVAQYFWSEMEQEEREVFKVAFFNRNLELLGERTLFTGGIDATIVDVRLIFKLGFSYLASSMIILHNHPSGSLIPSKSDKTITEKIKEAGRLFDIPLLDHLILSERGYYSFAEEGLI